MKWISQARLRKNHRHDEKAEGGGDEAADDGDCHRGTEAGVRRAQARATGSMPAPIAAVVMMIGRARLRQASMSASARDSPTMPPIQQKAGGQPAPSCPAFSLDNPGGNRMRPLLWENRRRKRPQNASAPSSIIWI
jgi:hypothetical protein